MVRYRDDSASLRAAQRRNWPVHKYSLGAEPSDDLSGRTTPEQRLEMMWPLALEAWLLSGKPIPDYSRDETPVVLNRRKVK